MRTDRDRDMSTSLHRAHTVSSIAYVDSQVPQKPESFLPACSQQNTLNYTQTISGIRQTKRLAVSLSSAHFVCIAMMPCISDLPADKKATLDILRSRFKGNKIGKAVGPKLSEQQQNDEHRSLGQRTLSSSEAQFRAGDGESGERGVREERW